MSRFCRLFCVSGMGQIYPQKETGRNSVFPAINNPAESGLSNTFEPPPQVNGSRRRIGFVGFDGVRTLDLAGPLDAFTASRALSSAVPHRVPYQLVVVGLKQKTFVSESGVSFRAQETTDSVTGLDTIIVPGGSGLQKHETLVELANWLAAHGS